MYNGSDSFTESELLENMYWQYFCGFEYFEKDPGVSEATIRRFRSAIGGNVVKIRLDRTRTTLMLPMTLLLRCLKKGANWRLFHR